VQVHGPADLGAALGPGAPTSTSSASGMRAGKSRAQITMKRSAPGAP
jgi:hypothetical protein